MGILVERKRTVLTEVELAAYLFQGHVHVFGGVDPSAERIGCAWAQNALELDRGKQIWNFNLGNVTAGKSWSGDFYAMRVPPPDPPILRFRSHASAIDGAIDYWRVMASHFGSALPLFDKGAATAVARELGRLHYYTADPNQYAPSVGKLYDEFLRRGLYADACTPLSTEIPSPEQLAITGRMWRLIDELDHGGLTGMDVIDKLGEVGDEDTAT